MMQVRHSKLPDVPAIMDIYAQARKFMRRHGNSVQWVGGYPSEEVIVADINASNHYCVMLDNKIAGVFSFIKGEEPTYAVIEGEWPDNNPYGTIHRIASAEGSHGVADCCLQYCRSTGVNIRVDTHAANAPMLAWITSRGFRHCGVIYVSDGTPREAFQLDCQSQ